MLSKTLLHHLRGLLAKSLKKIDDIEKQPPRAKKRAWFDREVRFHSLVVLVVSSLVLFVVFFWNLEPTLPKALATALFVIVMVGLFAFYVKRDLPSLAHNEEAMALLSLIFISTILIAKGVALLSRRFEWVSPYAAPIAAGPLLAALLLHARLALVLAFLLSTILGMVTGYSLDIALVTAVGSVSIIAFGGQARNGRQVARAGLMAGLTQVLMVFFIATVRSWDKTLLFYAVPNAFIGGQLSAFLCLGALPYLESFFSRVSNLRLLELSDVNHPLLKRMSLEAPGTYHHSLIVATLAEDAANAILANGLLARVGATYHDIGKMMKSEYFIENQVNTPNPHDDVSPSLSRLIITSHVKDGVALAREYKLDQPIVDFIPQHHGTSKIEFFYHKALKMEEHEDEDDKEDIAEETYRYPGPKPQSKEAGIVMLADSVEAAARTIEEPTHQRLKDLVDKIIDKKFKDGQLDDTPLTMRDLSTIGERFVATLQSVYHSRIPYPDVAMNDPDR